MSTLSARQGTRSRLCVVQAEDRPIGNGTGYLSRLLDSNRAACRAERGCLYLRRDNDFKDIAPHWRKVLLCALSVLLAHSSSSFWHLLQHPEYLQVFIVSAVLNSTQPLCPAVAWLDSDAVLAGRPAALLELLKSQPGHYIPQARDARYTWPEEVKGARPDGAMPHMAASGCATTTGAKPPPTASHKCLPSTLTCTTARALMLESLTHAPYIMLLPTPDLPLTRRSENDQYRREASPFNAGVFIVSNTKMGRLIFERWRQVWHELAGTHWQRNHSATHDGQDDKTWVCLQRDHDPATMAKTGGVTACDFSREFYEQGAFVRYVLTDHAFRHSIRLVPWWVLQNHRPRPLVHHFLGPPGTKRKYLTEVARYHQGPRLLVERLRS